MAATPRVLYDLIDTLIDSQISNTAILTTLLHIMKDSHEEIRDINSHFTNGFKSDLKDHISKEQEISKKSITYLQDHAEMIDKKLENCYREITIQVNNMSIRLKEDEARIKRVDEFVDSAKKLSTYMKWVVAVVIAIATIVGGVATVIEKWPSAPKTSTSPQQLPNKP